MIQKELSELKKMLLEKKEKILKVFHRDIKETEVGDEVDFASDSIEKEMLFELTDNERQILENIEISLTKIDNGNYGNCEKCDKKIPYERLKAMPFARFCAPCQSSNEFPKK